MSYRSNGYEWHQRNCGEHEYEAVDRQNFLQTSDLVVAKVVMTWECWGFGRDFVCGKFELYHCQNLYSER